jgi:hypothetical protein
MEAICSSKMFVHFRRTTRCYILKDRTLHNNRCDNLKSHVRPLAPPFCRHCLSFCPSAWSNFHEIWYFGVLLNSVLKFRFWFSSENNNGPIIWIHTWESARISSKIHQNSKCWEQNLHRIPKHAIYIHCDFTASLMVFVMFKQKETECTRIVTPCVHFQTCYYWVQFLNLRQEITTEWRQLRTWSFTVCIGSTHALFLRILNRN